MELVLVGALADRAVAALESVAESLVEMAATAQAQRRILEPRGPGLHLHQHHPAGPAVVAGHSCGLDPPHHPAGLAVVSATPSCVLDTPTGAQGSNYPGPLGGNHGETQRPEPVGKSPWGNHPLPGETSPRPTLLPPW